MEDTICSDRYEYEAKATLPSINVGSRIGDHSSFELLLPSWIALPRQYSNRNSFEYISSQIPLLVRPPTTVKI